MTGINYLFPPDQINVLPSWRFVLHFKAPTDQRAAQTTRVAEKLKSLALTAVTFPPDDDMPAYEPKTNTVAIGIEVTEARRQQAGSLADYESDVWKIFAAMHDCGFGDVYYEAVDWQG